jgi:cell division septum initiation protein DivIVA
MVERVRFNPKTSSKSITPAQARFALFGQPQLLEGEDAAAYDELLGRLCAAVKPVDIIDEMFTVDVAQLEWEVLRWRRLKLNLIRARQPEALKTFVDQEFGYDLRSEHFVDYLAGILQDILPEEEANAARTLASKCAQDKPDAIDKVNNVLAGIQLTMDQVETDARSQKVEELVQEYVRHNADAVTEIQELLADAGVSLEAITADELADRSEYLDYIERADRLAAIAESRRNASLREIDRRRAVLGGALRQGVQEVEDAEFKVIERRRPKGKDAA